MKEILKAEYGSRALGIHNENSDRDYMALVVEPPEYVTGLWEWQGRRDGTGSGPNGRFTAEDEETVVYSLRKWARLAAKGNPTVLQILFSESFENLTPEGGVLLSITDAFISQDAGQAFLGYMQSQKKALTGEKNKRTNRPELIKIHGYDTKYAGHLVRLGLQGIELMETGHLELPMAEADRGVLLDIRAGRISLSDVLDLSARLEENLNTAIVEGGLPEKADAERINTALNTIYHMAWT